MTGHPHADDMPGLHTPRTLRGKGRSRGRGYGVGVGCTLLVRGRATGRVTVRVTSPIHPAPAGRYTGTEQRMQSAPAGQYAGTLIKVRVTVTVMVTVTVTVTVAVTATVSKP